MINADLSRYDEWFKKMHNFDDYLQEKGQVPNAKEPDDPLCNPYTFYHHQEGTPVWSIMSQSPERFKTFQAGMAGIDLAIPVTGHFDFSMLKNTPDEDTRGVIQLIDVGGGRGAVLKTILDTYNDLKPQYCVLQDLAPVIALSNTDGLLPQEVRRMEHDFTTEQPLKGTLFFLLITSALFTNIHTGAKAYFMRMIMHDYADPVCIGILKNLAKAMTLESRVLICDMVIPSRVGELDFPAAVLDQAVMTMGGKERTREGFSKLLEAAGLELVEVWRAPGVPGGCVEGRLKR